MTLYKDDIQPARERTEAWWNHEIIDRIALKVPCGRDPGLQDPDPTPRVERTPEEVQREWTDVGRAAQAPKKWLGDMFYGGEAFPVAYPSFASVAVLGNFLGCPPRYEGDSVWSDPIIDNWEKRPSLGFNPDNKWWLLQKQMLEESVRVADGYSIGVPDLNGPTQILAQLRGTEPLLMDFYENAEYIKPALAEINQAWFESWRRLTAVTEKTGGYFYWMGIRSDRPSIDLQSDISCMMSPEMFDEFFLPFLDEQTQMVERTVYHLDGPDAVRHLDSLLGLPRLTGIQWEPGAGSTQPWEWIPLLRRILDAGKLVYTRCDKDHLELMIKELGPKGLLLAIEGCRSQQEAEKVLDDAVTLTKQHRNPSMVGVGA